MLVKNPATTENSLAEASLRPGRPGKNPAKNPYLKLGGGAVWDLRFMVRASRKTLVLLRKHDRPLRIFLGTAPGRYLEVTYYFEKFRLRCAKRGVCLDRVEDVLFFLGKLFRDEGVVLVERKAMPINAKVVLNPEHAIIERLRQTGGFRPRFLNWYAGAHYSALWALVNVVREFEQGIP